MNTILGEHNFRWTQRNFDCDRHDSLNFNSKKLIWGFQIEKHEIPNIKVRN